MSIKSDIFEITHWISRSSFPLRLYTVFSVVASFAALASLIESVLQFDQFLERFTSLYRLAKEPVASSAKAIGLDLSSTDIDVIVTFIVFGTAPILILAHKANGKWLTTDSFVFATPAFVVIISYGLLSSEIQLGEISVETAWLTYAIAAMWLSFIISIGWVTYKIYPFVVKALIVQFVLSASLLLVLSLVNVGLSGL